MYLIFSKLKIKREIFTCFASYYYFVMHVMQSKLMFAKFINELHSTNYTFVIATNTVIS